MQAEAAGYRVYRATSEGGPYARVGDELPPDARSFSDTSVAPDTTYYYVVRAFNIRGESPNSNEACATTTPTVLPSGPSRLLNLSVRADFAADSPLITGFVMSGGSKQLLVRAVGPGLAPYVGEGTTLAGDPRLDFYNSASVIVASNDNWGGGGDLRTAFTGVGAFSLPEDSGDAALVRPIDGLWTAYMHTTSAGLGLIEIYDAGEGSTVRLINVSARYQVTPGDGALTAGFVIEGPGAKEVLIRGVGPTLAAAPFGLPGMLMDPKLELFNGQQKKIAVNDDWPASLAGAFAQVGAFELIAGSNDAVLKVMLLPGLYTAQVTGGDEAATGEAMIEVYEMP